MKLLWYCRRRGWGIQSRLCICLSVCLSKRKTAELSTQNLVHIYSIVVARHALTKRSIGQSHTITKTVTVARLLMTRATTAVCCCIRRGYACRYNCLCFLVCPKSMSLIVFRKISINDSGYWHTAASGPSGNLNFTSISINRVVVSVSTSRSRDGLETY